MTSKEETWSRDTNLRLPFDVNVMLNLCSMSSQTWDWDVLGCKNPCGKSLISRAWSSCTNVILKPRKPDGKALITWLLDVRGLQELPKKFHLKVSKWHTSRKLSRHWSSSAIHMLNRRTATLGKTTNWHHAAWLLDDLNQFRLFYVTNAIARLGFFCFFFLLANRLFQRDFLGLHSLKAE